MIAKTVMMHLRRASRIIGFHRLSIVLLLPVLTVLGCPVKRWSTPGREVQT